MKRIFILIILSLSLLFSACVIAPNFKEKDEAWRVEFRHVGPEDKKVVGGMVLVSQYFAKAEESSRTEYDQQHMPQINVPQQDLNNLVAYFKEHKKSFRQDAKEDEDFFGCFDISFNFYGWIEPYRLLREDMHPLFEFMKEKASSDEERIQIQLLLEDLQ